MNVNLTKKQGVSAILILIIVCIVFVSIGLFLFKKEGKVVTVDETSPATFDEITWETYKNTKYNFSIDYPSHWEVEEDYTREPVINFYPSGTRPELPITDFDGNTTHLSIYPLGLARGGTNYQSRSFAIDVEEKSINSSDFVLANGGVWSRYLTFNSVPESWRNWGFIWAQLDVQNEERYCMIGGEKRSVEYCDPYINEVIIEGDIEKDKDEEVEIRMLYSFKFDK